MSLELYHIVIELGSLSETDRDDVFPEVAPCFKSLTLRSGTER